MSAARGPGDGPLPPRPDPVTGLPRPPAGPRWSLAGPHAAAHGHLVGLSEADRPAGLRPPPPDRGPALELKRGSWRTGVGMLALLAVPFVVVFVLNPTTLTSWWAWVLYAVLGTVAFVSVSRQYLAAGADWLQAGRTAWVDVYSLTSVTVAAGTGQHWVTLTDADDRHATVSTNDLHANPALWDLVYNGIRHSAAAGARITGSGARNLRPPPAKDRAEGHDG